MNYSTMENFKCELISWDYARELSEIVAEKIKKSGFKPDIIIAIIRGGLVPAMNLSDLLGIKDLLAIKVEHWGITATKSGKAELKVPLQTGIEGKSVLLVDDLTDTGESIKVSLNHLRELNPAEIKTATLLHKSQSEFKPDFYAGDRKEWKWIILPWNLNEDFTNLTGRILRKNPQMSAGELRSEMKKEFDLDIEEETIAGLMKRSADKG